MRLSRARKDGGVDRGPAARGPNAKEYHGQHQPQAVELPVSIGAVSGAVSPSASVSGDQCSSEEASVQASRRAERDGGALRETGQGGCLVPCASGASK